MRLIDIDRMPNFEVKTTDGKEYVLLPFKHLYSIPTVNAIPLERIKQAREEINGKYDDLANSFCEREQGRNEMIEEVLAILDKLIESEEK